MSAVKPIGRVFVAGERRIRSQNLPQFYEGPDDVDGHLHGTRAVQDRRCHDGAVLGES